jgi:hypothetical protein
MDRTVVNITENSPIIQAVISSPPVVNATIIEATKGNDGIGIEPGGLKGQYYKKKSDTDYDADWVTPDISELTDEENIIPTALSELSDDSTHRLVTDTEKGTWNGKADSRDILTALSELSDDSTHRLVTDTEKGTWNNHNDINAIHSNVSGEVNSLTLKSVPLGADVIPSEDSAAIFAKKKITIYSIRSWVTVGTGGDYATIYDALNAGKFNIKLISNVTETVTWKPIINAVNVPYVYIWSENMYSITLSVAASGGTSNLSQIFFSNVELKPTGTNSIFGNCNCAYFDNCKITGDASNNILYSADSSFLYANKITITTGAGSLQMYYWIYAEYMNLIGSGYTSGIYFYNGYCGYLKTSGTFGNNYINNWFVAGTNSIFNQIYIGHTDIASIRMFGSSVMKTWNLAMFIFASQNGWYVYDSTIHTIYANTNCGNNAILENCNITGFTYSDAMGTLKTFKNNTITNATTISYSNNIVENCKFTGAVTVSGNNCRFINCTFESSVTVSGDNCTFDGCYLSTSTITIQATSDKTIVTNCRSLNDVSDTGTNTILGNNLLI